MHEIRKSNKNRLRKNIFSLSFFLGNAAKCEIDPILATCAEYFSNPKLLPYYMYIAFQLATAFS